METTTAEPESAIPLTEEWPDAPEPSPFDFDLRRLSAEMLSRLLHAAEPGGAKHRWLLAERARRRRPEGTRDA